MIVARGMAMGVEGRGGAAAAGCGANGHMTVGRWGKGGRGSGGGKGRKGGGEEKGGKGGWGVGSARGGGGGGGGLSGGLDRGSVEPVQHKARGLTTDLKKN